MAHQASEHSGDLKIEARCSHTQDIPSEEGIP